MKSQRDHPGTYDPSNRSILDRHRDVMKELLANHRVSIISPSSEDDKICKRKRNLDDIVLHIQMMSHGPDSKAIHSSVLSNDFLFHFRPLLSDGTVSIATESWSGFNEEDIFYDCCSDDGDNKSTALTTSSTTTKDWPKVDFVKNQLVAADRDNNIRGVNGSTYIRVAGYKYCPSPQSIIALEGLLKLHFPSSSADANTAIDDTSRVNASQERAITMSLGKVRMSEIDHDRILQQRAREEETRLRAIIMMPRYGKESPQLKASQETSGVAITSEDNFLHEFESSFIGDQQTNSPGTQEESTGSHENALIASYSPRALVRSVSLPFVQSLDAGSNVTDGIVHSISAPNFLIDMSETTLLSSRDDKVQRNLTVHEAPGSVIVRPRRNCRTISPLFVASGIGLNAHSKNVIVQIRGSWQGNNLSCDEPLSVEVTQQHPGGFVCDGNGLPSNPNIELVADSGDVLADCSDRHIDNGVCKDPNVELVADHRVDDGLSKDPDVELVADSGDVLADHHIENGLCMDPNVEFVADSGNVLADCPDPHLENGICTDPNVEHVTDSGDVLADCTDPHIYDGLCKDPNVELVADLGDVLKECPDPHIYNGLHKDPNLEHVADSGVVLADCPDHHIDDGLRKDPTDSEEALVDYPDPRVDSSLGKDPIDDNASDSGKVFTDDEMMRRETSSDMQDVNSVCDTLTEDSKESLTISHPVSPPEPIRQISPSKLGHDNRRDFWSDIHDEPMLTTHNGSGGSEQVELYLPTINSTMQLEIHSPFHALSFTRNETTIPRSSKNSPHLIPSPRRLLASPSRTAFSEPFLRTRKRAEIRRQSIHDSPSTPHRVPATGSCSPMIHSTVHFATGALSPLSADARLRAAHKAGSPSRKQLDVPALESPQLISLDVKSRKCTRKFRAKAHATMGPCDRCWTLATPPERTRFTRRGSSLFVAQTRGGCDLECMMFPEYNGRSVRLCRHCFQATHV